MRVLGVAIGVLVTLAGAISFATPDVLLSLGRWVATPGGLYAVGALRIVLGLAFVLAASASRAPRTLRVVGVVVLIAGLATPLFGVARTRVVLDWAADAGPSFMRLPAGVAMAIGACLVYAFRSPEGISFPWRFGRGRSRIARPDAPASRRHHE